MYAPPFSGCPEVGLPSKYEEAQQTHVKPNEDRKFGARRRTLRSPDLNDNKFNIDTFRRGSNPYIEEQAVFTDICVQISSGNLRAGIAKRRRILQSSGRLGDWNRCLESERADRRLSEGYA